jgi:hypothetical protein
MNISGHGSMILSGSAVLFLAVPLGLTFAALDDTRPLRWRAVLITGAVVGVSICAPLFISLWWPDWFAALAGAVVAGPASHAYGRIFDDVDAAKGKWLACWVMVGTLQLGVALAYVGRKEPAIVALGAVIVSAAVSPLFKSPYDRLIDRDRVERSP